MFYNLIVIYAQMKNSMPDKYCAGSRNPQREVPLVVENISQLLYSCMFITYTTVTWKRGFCGTLRTHLDPPLPLCVIKQFSFLDSQNTQRKRAWVGFKLTALCSLGTNGLQTEHISTKHIFTSNIRQMQINSCAMAQHTLTQYISKVCP